MNGMALVLLLAVTLPLGAIVTFMPYLTRRTESFGVSIEAKYYDDSEIGGMRRSYAIGTGTFSLLAVLSGAWVAASLGADHLGWLLPALTGAMLAVHLALYLRFHFRMRALKERRGLLSAEMQQTVVETGFHRERRAHSNVWLIPHLIVAAATAWLCIAYYDQFPDRIVMQFDLEGNPTNIVDKRYPVVLLPVGLQLLLILIYAVVNYGIAASKQQIDADDPRGSLQRNLIFRRKWSGFILVTGFLMTAMFGSIPLQMLLQYDPGINAALWLALIVIILLSVVRLGFVTGQGGSRIRLPGAGAATGKANRDDDKYWILGQFYFNPDDPALFLEKRFGIGWTLNFARPLAWIIFLAPILVVALLVYLAERG
jgi:uncharacterized membrane protein